MSAVMCKNLRFRHGVQYTSTVSQLAELTNWLLRGPHLSPHLVRHISLTKMGAEGREVPVDPRLQQCKTTSNSLAPSPRHHTQLPIQIRKSDCTPSNLILIGIRS